MAESHFHGDKYSDHQHDIAWNNDEETFEPVTDFEYDSIDRNVFGNEPEEDTVSFSDMCAALSLIVGWACASPDLKHVGGRIAALQVLLDPTNAPHGRETPADVAREWGVTRAAVSAWLLDFRDQAGVSLTSASVAASGQLIATHSSQQWNAVRPPPSDARTRQHS